jgi:hypothetical protein
MELTPYKQDGFGNRMQRLNQDEFFNGYKLKKGLETDGGSIPKIFIIGLFLLLNSIYDFHWLTNVLIFAIAIDESNGWFQKPFFAHDQRWSEAQDWGDFYRANWLFFKDMNYKVSNYRGNPPVKAVFHMTLGYLLTVMYPLAVTTFGIAVFYFKYQKGR